jgi:hypothetical protein
MSLINDALRKARVAQDQSAPSAPLAHFQSAQPVQPVRRGLGVMLPVGFAIVALLLLAAVWIWSQRREVIEVRAKPQAVEIKPDAPLAQPVAATTELPQPTGAVHVPALAPAPALVSTAEPLVETASAASATPAGCAPATAKPGVPPQPDQPQVAGGTAQAPATTNAVVLPAEPKLMGIVFDPRRPSAVINGKTVFVGEKVAGQRVQAITANTCLLVGGGKTNLLSLEE